jgi:mRNA interferase RelE/StbE
VANYKILIKSSAVKELAKLLKKDIQRIISKIKGLSTDPRPHGCEKLSAQERYRIRQGNYRIVYSIEDDKLIVFVIKIVHRSEVYSNLIL